MSTEAKCPMTSGAHRHTVAGGPSNANWWPNQLKLNILHQHSSKSDPMGAGFDYASEFRSLDLEAVKRDLVALMTGYTDAPASFSLAEGKYYNKAFAGHQISMPPPLSEGVVTYQDGTPGTVENYAHDVAAFLSWTADPHFDQRKRIGWQVILYLIVTTILLYIGKKRIWSAIKH